MKSLQRLGLASGLLTGLVASAGHYHGVDGEPRWISAAHAQPQSEEERKRQQQKGQEHKGQEHKGQNPQPKAQQQPQPPPRPQANPNPGVPSNPQRNAVPQNSPQSPPPNSAPPVKQVNPQFLPKGPGPGNPGTPPNTANPGNPGQPRFLPKAPAVVTPNTPPPNVPGPGTPNPGNSAQPRFLPNPNPAPNANPGPNAGPPGQFAPKGNAGTPPGFQRGPGSPPGPGPAPGNAAFIPKRLDQVQGNRQQRVEDGGRRTVITEPGNRFIIKQDNRIIIRHDESDRFRFGARDVRTSRGPGGTTETFFLRPDGSRVVTVNDPSGRILRRYRRDPYGREINIIDNRRFYRNVAIGVGVGILGAAVLLNLPRPVIDIPPDRYIVNYDRASDDDLFEALSAPPLMPLERAYSLEEIRDNYSLRERMRSVDLDNITFESGSFEVTPEQFPMLERIARIIGRVIERRPDEVFLIEGHTDATGSPEDNLSLSDRRAQAVAQVLSESFAVPPENLVTQGYGDQYLKIDTPGPERANRRVTVRRISPLMAQSRAFDQ